MSQPVPDFPYRQTRHVPGAAGNKGGKKKKERERKRKSWEEPQLHSHIIAWQYRLIWYQNDGDLISFCPVQLVLFHNK